MACTSWVLLCCPKHVEGPGIDPPTPGLADTPLFPLCHSDYNESNDSTHETALLIWMVVSMHLSASVCNLHGLTFCLLPSQYGPAPLQKALLDNLKPNRTCLTQHSSALTHAPPPLWNSAGKQMQMVCLCLCVLFWSPCFFSAYALPFPSSLTAQYTPLLPKTRSVPRSLPLLWFCRSSHDQARYPSNYLALSNKATTDSNEEWNIKDRHCLCSHYLSAQETERRSESSGTCREATTTFSLPFLDKYHQWEQQSQTCPGSLVTAYLFV